MALYFVPFDEQRGDTAVTFEVASRWFLRSSDEEDAYLFRMQKLAIYPELWEFFINSLVMADWKYRFQTGWTPLTAYDRLDDPGYQLTHAQSALINGLRVETWAEVAVSRLEEVLSRLRQNLPLEGYTLYERRIFGVGLHWLTLVVVNAVDNYAQMFARRLWQGDVWLPVDAFQPLPRGEEDEPTHELVLWGEPVLVNKFRNLQELLISYLLGGRYWEASDEAERLRKHYRLPHRGTLHVNRIVGGPVENYYAMILRKHENLWPVRSTSTSSASRFYNRVMSSYAYTGTVIAPEVLDRLEQLSGGSATAPTVSPLGAPSVDTEVMGDEFSVLQSIWLELRLMFPNLADLSAIAKRHPGGHQRKVLCGLIAARDSELAEKQRVIDFLNGPCRELFDRVRGPFVTVYHYVDHARRVLRVFLLCYLTVDWKELSQIQNVMSNQPLVAQAVHEFLSHQRYATIQQPVSDQLKTYFNALWATRLQKRSGSELLKNVVQQQQEIFYWSEDNQYAGIRGNHAFPYLQQSAQVRFANEEFQVIAPDIFPVPWTFLYYTGNELRQAGYITSDTEQAEFDKVRTIATERLREDGDVRHFRIPEDKSLLDTVRRVLSLAVIDRDGDDVDSFDSMFNTLLGRQTGFSIYVDQQVEQTSIFAPLFQRVFYIYINEQPSATTSGAGADGGFGAPNGMMRLRDASVPRLGSRAITEEEQWVAPIPPAVFDSFEPIRMKTVPPPDVDVPVSELQEWYRVRLRRP